MEFTAHGRNWTLISHNDKPSITTVKHALKTGQHRGSDDASGQLNLGLDQTAFCMAKVLLFSAYFFYPFEFLFHFLDFE